MKYGLGILVLIRMSHLLNAHLTVVLSCRNLYYSWYGSQSSKVHEQPFIAVQALHGCLFVRLFVPIIAQWTILVNVLHIATVNYFLYIVWLALSKCLEGCGVALDHMVGIIIPFSQWLSPKKYLKLM